MQVQLRSLRDDETELLKDFLYEAIFLPEGVEAPDRSVIEQPELAIYYDGFGKGKADNCIIAEADGKVVGAVWTRIMNDYGHVDDETPSFAISLYKEYRGRGIGTMMMRQMLELLKKQGYEKASLAVQKANYAVRMYENVGFETAYENDEEYIMVCSLRNELLENIDRIHTTELGAKRIKRNLGLTDDVVEWCRKKIMNKSAVIKHQGKNWHIKTDDCIITVNASSYTIITAHKEK